MSVLYKALQKAEKENELRQSAASDSNFDPQRLAASGALKFAGGRGQAMNRFVMGGVGLVAIALGVAFVLFQDDLTAPQPGPPSSRPVAALSPPAPQNPSGDVALAPSTAAATSEDSPGVEAASAKASPPASSSGQVADAHSTAGEAPQTPLGAASEAQVTSQTPSVPVSPSTEDTKNQSPAAERSTLASSVKGDAESSPEQSRSDDGRTAPKPAPRAVAQRPDPVPPIAADSPARMLSPPITVTRAEFGLAGVGDQVQVREVGASARNNASAGYDALVRGSYDTALGFYDAALKEEPNSVLALLGKAASLQKLGRSQEAQVSYDQVLKLDPQNREALTNLTMIVAERSPQDAIIRLLDLEREYQSFSPIKAQIGLTYAKIGSMGQALDYLSRAVALSPESVMYQYNLALVLDHLGRKEQAVESYERVLSSISSGRGAPELSPTEIERRVRFLRAR